VTARYLNLLKSGGSGLSMALLKTAGVDLTQQATVQASGGPDGGTGGRQLEAEAGKIK